MGVAPKKTHSHFTVLGSSCLSVCLVLEFIFRFGGGKSRQLFASLYQRVGMVVFQNALGTRRWICSLGRPSNKRHSHIAEEYPCCKVLKQRSTLVPGARSLPGLGQARGAPGCRAGRQQREGRVKGGCRLMRNKCCWVCYWLYMAIVAFVVLCFVGNSVGFLLVCCGKIDLYILLVAVC